MRVVLVVSYDGTDFCGWQVQPNGRTVQEEIEKALFSVLGVKTRITGSGRTDSGVHALGQTCHFDADTSIPANKFSDCLNRILPPDVRVMSSYEADENFDCNRSAKKKTYLYNIYLSDKIQPLKERYAVKYSLPVDEEKMRESAKFFVGEHDFKAFCASGSQVKTTVRTVFDVRIEIKDGLYGKDVAFFVTGNGFLYNMVRSIVGCILDTASGKMSFERLKEAIDGGDRSLIGRTMPAKGLVLYQVDYCK